MIDCRLGSSVFLRRYGTLLRVITLTHSFVDDVSSVRVHLLDDAFAYTVTRRSTISYIMQELCVDVWSQLRVISCHLYRNL